MRPGRLSILLRLAALMLLAGAGAAIGFGYLGALHPAFDAFSHFRLHIAAMLVVFSLLLLLLSFRLEAGMAFVLAAATTSSTLGLPAFLDPSPVQAEVPDGTAPGTGFRLLHVNLRFDNSTPGAVLSLIGRAAPDVITLNEVSTMWRERLAVLEQAYPHRIICDPPSRIGGVAILSRRPFMAGSTPRCRDRGSFAIATISFGGRAVDVATLHLGWPWPFHQPGQIPRLEEALSGVGQTAILAADLNSAPWSHSVRRIAEKGDLRIVDGVRPTWLHRRLPDALRRTVGLPIDHVMAKGGVLSVGIRTGEGVGSDHLPLIYDFILLPEEPGPDVLQARFGSGPEGS